MLLGSPSLVRGCATLLLAAATLCSLRAQNPALLELPPGGRLLNPADLPARIPIVPPEAHLRLFQFPGLNVVPWSWQVETLVDLAKGDAIDFQLPLKGGVAAGDVGFVRFVGRALATTDESGTGRIELNLGAPDGVSAFVTRVSFGRDWQEFVLPFRAEKALPAGSAFLGVGFGFMKQRVEVGGFDVRDFGPKVRLEQLPRTRFSYAGREATARWRRSALSRIEQLRKGDIHLQVVDEKGQPVAGAQVQVREVRSEFQWGSALQFARLVQDSPDNLRYREKVLELFNAASPENDLKWVTWAGDWGGAYSHDQALAGLRWLREHHFHARGHVLVWPGKKNLPKSVVALLVTSQQERIPERVDAHIREMAAATRDDVEEWDTLNEPMTNHDLMDELGRPAMAHWFEVAHAAMPKVRLYLNDFSNHDRTTDLAHVQAFEAVVKELQAAKAPLGGLGLQAHIGEQPNAPVEVLRMLREYDQFNLPLRVTEFDFQTDDEQLQADYTRDFLTLMFSHPSVIGVQVWGFWAGAHWRPSAAMYRPDWSEKPNGAVYRDLVLNQWRTHLEASTGPNGRLDGRGFYGDYTVDVSAGARRSHLEFTLAAGAPYRTITIPLISSP